MERPGEPQKNLIDLSPQKEQFREAAEIYKALELLEQSRKENPNPRVLEIRRKNLESRKVAPEVIERTMKVDEAIVRMTALMDSGISTLSVFNLLHASDPTLTNTDIQCALWDLTDQFILRVDKDRKFYFNPNLEF
jgi:hypothetical protein